MTGLVSRRDKTVERIATSVLRLEVSKGHLKWKVTDLQARAKISRSLIYRYFGNTKEGILRRALKVFTDKFYVLGEAETGAPFAERIRHSKRFLIENPEAILFYQKWRSKDSWISIELKRSEQEFQNKLRQSYPHLSEQQVYMVHSFVHGLVTAPFLNGEQVLWAVRELEVMMSRAPLDVSGGTQL